MRKNTVLIYTITLLVGDFLAILGSFITAYILRVSIDPRPLVQQVPALTYLQIFIVLLPFWLIIFAFLGLYKQEVYTKRFNEAARLFVGTFIGILFIIGYDFVTKVPVLPARLVIVYAFILGFSLLVLERNLLWQIRKLFFRRGIGVNRIMLIGSADTTKDIANLLHDTRTSGYHVAVIVGGKDTLPDWFSGHHYTNIDNALSELEQHKIDTVIQTKLYESEQNNRKILDATRLNHIDYKFIPAEGQFYTGKSSVELFHYFPVISVHPTPLLGWGRILKRAFDIFVSLVSIIITFPLMVLFAILIKATDLKGPVLFRQRRVTRFSSQFYALKFRTMLWKYCTSNSREVEIFRQMGREDLAQEFVKNRGKVKNDPRITGIGRFLRATSLDELPQLFNVLKGDISLVGPRAITENHAKEYEENRPLMLSVKTGITGLAQVSGRDDLSLEERIRLDVYYVQNWSFWLDIRILLKTFYALIARKGFRS